MGAPKAKLFGSLNLSNIKKAATEVPSKVGEYKGDKQLKVTAAIWEDGGVSIEVWNGDAKESIKIGNLRLSTFDDAPKAESNSGADLPF